MKLTQTETVRLRAICKVTGRDFHTFATDTKQAIKLLARYRGIWSKPQ